VRHYLETKSGKRINIPDLKIDLKDLTVTSDVLPPLKVTDIAPKKVEADTVLGRSLRIMKVDGDNQFFYDIKNDLTPDQMYTLDQIDSGRENITGVLSILPTIDQTPDEAERAQADLRGGGVALVKSLCTAKTWDQVISRVDRFLEPDEGDGSLGVYRYLVYQQVQKMQDRIDPRLDTGLLKFIERRLHSPGYEKKD